MAEWGLCRGPDFIRLCRRRGRMNEDGHWSTVNRRLREKERKILSKID